MMAALLTAAQEHEPTNAERAASLLQQADADGDGGLSNGEVRSALHLDPTGPAAGLEKIGAAFDRLDGDRDGRLGASELAAGLDRLALDPDAAMRLKPDIASFLVQQADADGDSRLTADDIAAGLGGAVDTAALAAGIARWDLDQDGGLDVDELRAALR
jgi:Ca2+-binding EF-hand superfamily protein